MSLALQTRRTRLRRRTIGTIVLAVIVVALFVLILTIGERIYSPLDVFRVILGQDVPGASFTVGRLRLPRAVIALLVGAAFGIAGSMFQRMLRNPLASPDVIGIGYGSSASAVIAIGFFGATGFTVSVVAIVGGLVVAFAIYLLAWRGGVHGARLVLIGIAVGAMLLAIVQWVLTRIEIYKASEALRWISGSLNNAFWGDVPPLAIALVLLVPAAFFISRRLGMLELGDEAAAALGVRPERTRLLVVVIAVGLTSVATAAAGPISFVAFLAGPIATRILPGTTGIVAPALVGSALVLAGDFVGGTLLPYSLPVGVVTALVGAPYLLWLIGRTTTGGRS
jgi:iron complex transport system permease protein